MCVHQAKHARLCIICSANAYPWYNAFGLLITCPSCQQRNKHTYHLPGRLQGVQLSKVKTLVLIHKALCVKSGGCLRVVGVQCGCQLQCSGDGNDPVSELGVVSTMLYAKARVSICVSVHAINIDIMLG